MTCPASTQVRPPRSKTRSVAVVAPHQRDLHAAAHHASAPFGDGERRPGRRCRRCGGPGARSRRSRSRGRRPVAGRRSPSSRTRRPVRERDAGARARSTGFRRGPRPLGGPLAGRRRSATAERRPDGGTKARRPGPRRRRRQGPAAARRGAAGAGRRRAWRRAGPPGRARATRRWRRAVGAVGDGAPRPPRPRAASTAQGAVGEPDQQRLLAVAVLGHVAPVRRRHLLARAEQAAHDRARARAQQAGCLAVREADHVDGDDRVAQRIGQLRDRGVGELGVERAVGVGAPSATHSRSSGGSRRRAAARGRPRLAQRLRRIAQQVDQVVVAPQEARAPQHLGVRVLHEVLGVLARAAHRVRRAEEAVAMVGEPVGIQRPPIRRDRHGFKLRRERHAARGG